MLIEVILSFIYPNNIENILSILLLFIYILFYFKSLFYITIQFYLSLLILYYIMLFYELKNTLLKHK